MNRRRRSTAVIAVAVWLAAPSCSSGPRAIAYGDEPCSHCHMTIVDPRFAGELISATGRVYPFDDVGCLAAFVSTGPLRGGAVGVVLVNLYLEPDSMVPATSAVYLRSPSLTTPMASGLAALRPGPQADSVRHVLGGELLAWKDVIDSGGGDGPGAS